MTKKPRFSVLLSFQDERDRVEPALSALFGLSQLPFELIIIDDASTDGTRQAIQSLLDYYQHDHTFFFEHETRCGRGNALNEALLQAGTDIIWAPNHIQSVDEQALTDSINALRNANVPCIMQQEHVFIPEDTAGWIDLIASGPYPADGHFIWNLRAIAAAHRFFNPYIQDHHALDWMLRIGVDALQADPSFYTPLPVDADDEAAQPDRRELVLSMLRRNGNSQQAYATLTELLAGLPTAAEPEQPETEQEDDLLQQAVALKKDGQLSAALDYIEQILRQKPDDSDAKQLKIKILEQKRRFVEASELKHELQSHAETVHPKVDGQHIKTTIIIPTALYGKPALEHCLVSIANYCNPASTQLIIVDNASLDDTHDYLNELNESNFFNCDIITNKTNQGFAASVNQGLEAAQSPYACVLHNDVAFDRPTITTLEELMDSHPAYAVIGPVTNQTLNPNQHAEDVPSTDEPIIESTYIDSFCMMIRTNTGLRFDEEYTLAYLDDIDFCFQARQQGYKTGIAPGVEVTHHRGNTTRAFDLDTDSELYWRNVTHFNTKWDIAAYDKQELDALGTFDQLIALDQLANPLYPEEKIKQRFEALFTDEMRTEIMKSSHDEETLRHLVHLMMLMDKRDIMRRLEDRLDRSQLPVSYIYELVRFYYDRNIYSRCMHYLNELEPGQESLQSELYRLAILIDEKKMEEAIPKLYNLLEKAPAHPFLHKLAGDMHAFAGDEQEAASFYQLAHQINPFDYSENASQFDLR